jgi:ubiquinone/menaquinone biosynthesis C-methylase UbiE
MREELKAVLTERQRIQAEYQRRAKEIKSDLYSPWQPAEIFFRTGRKAVAAGMLNEALVFPRIGDTCLEVGCGTGGWLADLISWGVREPDLHGIDIDTVRINRAKEILPAADLRIGDAAKLPWDQGTFSVVIASTLFTGTILPSIILRTQTSEESVEVKSESSFLDSWERSDQ